MLYLLPFIAIIFLQPRDLLILLLSLFLSVSFLLYIGIPFWALGI